MKGYTSAPISNIGDITESSFRGSPIQYLKSALSVNTHYGCNLNCAYCILSAHGFPEKPEKMTTPEDVVRMLFESGYPIEIGMPIAVNNKSEPLHNAVKRDTFRVLEPLSQRKITNPIQIISKLGYDDSDLKFLKELGLKLYHFTSYSALPKTVEHTNTDGLCTMRNIADKGFIKSIHYWRPIIQGVNDDIEQMADLLEFVAKNCDASLVSGIKLPKTVIKNLKDRSNIELEYDRISTEIKRLDPNVFRTLARISHEKYPDFPLFRHTSCIFSYFEGYPDYWNNYTFGDSDCNSYCSEYEKCTSDHFSAQEKIEKEVRKFSDKQYISLPRENLILLPDDITLDEFSYLLFTLKTRVARRKDIFLMWDMDEDKYVRKYGKNMGWGSNQAGK